MLPKLIALYSPAPGCGKSTVAEILKIRFGYTPLKLAHTIKGMTKVFLMDFGIPEGDALRYLEGDLKNERIPGLPATARRLMQTLGTEWGREYIHPEIWVTLCLNRAATTYGPVVVDDMRFINEYEGLKAAGAYLISVMRPGKVDDSGHRSEGALDGKLFDAVIVNDGTIGSLRTKVLSLVTRHQRIATPFTV